MSCAAGFIAIVDPFLNPDSTPWNGTITYTLLTASSVAGATIVGSRLEINVTNGISLCLAPGIYSVSLQQSGQRLASQAQWTVPASGGPYTVAQLGGAALWFSSTAGQVIVNNAGTVEGIDNFTINDFGTAPTSFPPTSSGLYAGFATAETTATDITNSSIVEFNGSATSAARFVGSQIVSATASESSGPLTRSGFNGSLVGALCRVSHNGSGLVTRATGLAVTVGSVSASSGGNITAATGVTINAGAPPAGATYDSAVDLRIVGIGASGTIGTRIGIQIDDLSSFATLHYAVQQIGAADIVSFAGLFVLPPSTPASSAAAGIAGQIKVDASYVYVCTATNAWKRAALSAF